MTEINSADFVVSNTNAAKCPNPDKPEYAFIGRSNVGKSSLINMITGRKGLSKTSSTPGKTQLINHFLINQQWYLVDLPGYGYAKVPKKLREAFTPMIKEYISSRSNLMNLFLLIDSRLPLQNSDEEFMNWLGEHGIPFSIIYTKCDKLSKLNLDKNLATIRRELSKSWENLPTQFISSAEKALGKEEILSFIEEVNKGFQK